MSKFFTAAPEKNIVVNALAGTGKTFTIIEGVNRLIAGPTEGIVGSPEQEAIWKEMEAGSTPKSILFLAFNKSIATEIGGLIRDPAKVKTTHGWGFGQLMRNGKKCQLDEKGLKLVQQLCQLRGCDNGRELAQLYPDYISAVRNLTSKLKLNMLATANHLPDDETINRIIMQFGIEVPDRGNDVIREDVRTVLKWDRDIYNWISFDDMVWLPNVLGVKVDKQDLLVVDERQDLSAAQQELIMKSGKRIVIVGDINQAIYGFAGADYEACKNMEQRLLHHGTGSRVFPLTCTRRCSKAVVKEAQKYVPTIKAMPNARKGRVVRITEAKFKSMLMNEKIHEGDMVVCRVNQPLVNYAMKCLKFGITARIQGRDLSEEMIRMVKSAEADTVEGLEKALHENLIKVISRMEKRGNSELAIDAVKDKTDCVLVFCEGATSIKQVIDRITEVFDETKNQGILFSSIHRAKGLEAKNVWFLRDNLCPHPMAKQDWEREQEMNLRYVAITRAESQLIYVTGEEKKNEQRLVVDRREVETDTGECDSQA